VRRVSFVARGAEVLPLWHLGLQTGSSSRLQADDLLAVAEASVRKHLGLQLFGAMHGAMHDDAVLLV